MNSNEMKWRSNHLQNESKGIEDSSAINPNNKNRRQRKGKVTPASSKSPSIFRLFGIKIGLLLLIVLIAGYWLFTGNTPKKETNTFVEQVQDLATLATAQASVKVIIEKEDNKLFGKEISYDLPGTKREVLIVVPATVIAGVDLKGLTSNEIKVDEKEKKIEIVLPEAKLLQDPAIQMDKVVTFSDEGLLRSKVDWDEGFDLAEEAQMKIQEEAIQLGLMQTAEQNAEKVLKEFFQNLGYTVKVSFH